MGGCWPSGYVFGHQLVDSAIFGPHPQHLVPFDPMLPDRFATMTFFNLTSFLRRSSTYVLFNFYASPRGNLILKVILNIISRETSMICFPFIIHTVLSMPQVTNQRPWSLNIYLMFCPDIFFFYAYEDIVVVVLT